MDFETLAVDLGSFPLDYGPSHPQSDSRTTFHGIRSLIGFGNLVGPLALSVLYLRETMIRGYTSIYFGENQLSPSLIGLSPLSTGHPSNFQLTSVRSSTQFYLSFNLPMDRSPGFGSNPQYLSPCSDSLSLRLRSRLTSHYRLTRWPVMQKARGHGTSPLPQLVGNWFQVLLHSPNRGSFHLSLTVLVHYRSSGSI